MTRSDRREVAFLGTVLLGWALVVTPLVHQLVEHGAQSPEQLGRAQALPIHGPGHSHGPSVPGQHGEGSLEHGKAFFTSPAAVPSLVLVVVGLAVVAVVVPAVVDLDLVDGTSQPQGP